ncbi:hypothetical protein H072_2472 [Dactylellina haptotyla CBS 200.50]|uniref:Uncharacterized protein n=1 Tax=Dactylellina haptotyla (strain CBS 200.50) TaxID=1284197 RepID=S8AR35_DACHA|nr:hypothetical protein H072_2472 [Dactylellina haptotyla CBS 200.50]
MILFVLLTELEPFSNLVPLTETAEIFEPSHFSADDMSYYGPDPFQRDPYDSRYHDYGNNGNGAAEGYYDTEIEIEDDSDPAYVPQHSALDLDYHPQGFQWQDFSNPSSITGGSYSSFGGPTSRGITSTDYTTPDMEDANFRPSGPKCIFYWSPIACRQQFHDYELWMEHINGHFPQSRHRGQPEFANMPNYWNCGFGCNFSITNVDDPKRMWDEKLYHFYDHLRDQRNLPEFMQEDRRWMEYYASRGLCDPIEYRAHLSHPPAHKPYSNPSIEFRKFKPPKKFRGINPHEDAPGEPAAQPPYVLDSHGQLVLASAFTAPPDPHYRPVPPADYNPHNVQPGYRPPYRPEAGHPVLQYTGYPDPSRHV